MKSQVKTIGAGGQIYLGKEYAGQHVLVTQREPGVWQIQAADVIPHNERFWHRPEVDARMQRALAEAAQHPAKATSEEEMEALFARALEHAERREKARLEKAK
jgi:hypothetical protein